MQLTLGIDTGGTFTDSVIFDLNNQKVVAKAKSPTTYKDLAVGILNSVNNLEFDKLDEIKLVALSTTMATNAIVEGRGCEVGLILIGEEPTGTLPVEHYAVIRGGHDIKGNAKDDLDLQEVEQVLEGFAEKVEAIAISGFTSVRNPEHELKVKELVEQKLNLPVVCGHQLTTSLGFHERSVTAALNAKLIPIITNLIRSVKKALSEKGINAPIMVVKGDGTLMSESVAIEKPIDTILSGPAASIIGATALTNTPEALILDMGGTTTDIAILQEGVPRINPEGATVGGWLTRVEAADISTYGMGGDSYIRVHKDGNLLIGPQKVWPLSLTGAKYPYLFDELEQQRKNWIKIRASEIADSYILLRKYSTIHLTKTEINILKILESGPHTLLFLANFLGKHPFSLSLDRLVKMGIVAKVAVTPTDILHMNGTYNEWDKEIATLGIEMLAEIMGMSSKLFIELALNAIVNKLSLAVLQSIFKFEGAPKKTANNLESDYLINKILAPNGNDILKLNTSLKVPIVGIGAPVRAYLPKVAQKLNCELIISQDSDVANAIGAAAGKVMEKVKMTINPTREGYLLYSQWERKKFIELEEAKKYAMEQAENQAVKMAEKSGATDYKIIKSCNDFYSKGNSGIHLETIIEITIIGSPNW